MTGNQRSSDPRRRLTGGHGDGHGDGHADGRRAAVLAVVAAIGASSALAWLPADVASASTAARPAAGRAVAGRAAPGRAVEIRAPLNAAPNPFAHLVTVSCTSARSCTAGGGYDDASEFGQAMIVTMARGRWARARELAMPADAAANPNGSVASLSCARPGFCVAVGSYSPNPPGQERGFIATESNGKWGRAVRPWLPLNAAAATDAGVFGVTCTGRRSCVAVGFYQNSSGQFEGMAIAKSRGRWGRATPIAPPRNATADPEMTFNGVSCASAGSCAAVGLYQARSFKFEAMAATESKGRWARATEIRQPANGVAGSVSNLVSVSCTGARSCVAAGSYRDPSGSPQGMAVTESRGRWARATEISLPADARAVTPDAQLSSVSCIRAGFCVAAGGYINAGAAAQAMRATEAGGRWRRARKVSPPSNVGLGPDEGSLAFAVTCVPSQACVAVGYYFITSTNREAMAATLPLP